MLHFLYNKFFGFCSHHVAFSTKVSGSLLVITLVISHYIRYILYIRTSCFLVITLHLLYYKFLLFHCHNVALSIHIIPYLFSIITQLICYSFLFITLYLLHKFLTLSQSSCCILYKINSLLSLIQPATFSALKIHYCFSVKGWMF